ncbi:MAG: FG-GAP-like repeat-containing protein [Phycisphaerales bacterium]
MPRLAILLATLGMITFWTASAAGQACTEPDTICLVHLDGTIGVRYDAADAAGQAGHAVAFAGDLNGDGIDDLAVGEYEADGGYGGPGAVYLVYGKAAPFGARESLVALGQGEGTRLTPPPGVSGFGFELARLGDLDGDGYDDLAIGCYDRYGGVGRAYVLFGRAGGFPANASLDDPGVRSLALTAATPLSYASVAVSSAGDFNADGRPDLAIGAPYAGAGGEAYVLWGRDVPGGAEPFPEALTLGAWPASVGLTLRGGPGQAAGSSVAGAPFGRTGDANGDGINDLLVGAPLAAPAGRSRAGRFYLVYGSTAHGTGGRTIDLPAMPAGVGVRFDGLEERQYVGSRVAFLGDLNADGLDDFGTFSPAAGPSGSVDGRGWIRFGRAPGDGFLPIEPLWADDAGRGFELRADRALSRYFGVGAAAIGDFDGDGIDDALIGASLTSYWPPYEAGRGFILQGARSWPARVELGSSPERYIPIDGDSDDQEAGASVAGLGDLNGDGLADLVLGAPGQVGDAGPPGAAYVVFGGAIASACPADVDRDGALTVFDFLAFQNLFGDGDPRADLDGDGALTLFDFLAFQTAFDAGCG